MFFFLLTIIFSFRKVHEWKQNTSKPQKIRKIRKHPTKIAITFLLSEHNSAEAYLIVQALYVQSKVVLYRRVYAKYKIEIATEVSRKLKNQL